MAYKLKEFPNVKNIYRNLSVASLYEHSLKWPNVKLTSTGALSILTGEKTGRSPDAKRIVLSENYTEDLWWSEGTPNIPMSNESYQINKNLGINYLNSLQQLYIFDGYIGWDLEYRKTIRIISSKPYHLLFCKNMLIEANNNELLNFNPEYTMINAGAFSTSPLLNDLTSSSLIAFHFENKEILILGTEYTGEIKKSIFSLMHYLMTLENVLTLHSSVNVGPKGPSIFFGLSGTGKTTLSSDPNMSLIGDDEHCWTDKGLFNIEGGCYAKCLNLNKEKEPDIFNAISYGAVLENIILDEESRVVDYKDDSITQNTRVSYSINKINNTIIPCVCPHPVNIILLTCDSFGLLPLVSKLSLNQALYYFISGFTTKMAGTEQGIDTPISTFSSCFGGAFLTWHPWIYALLLKEKMEKHNTQAWLVNTGWVGEKTKQRVDINISRKIITEINNGNLINNEFDSTPIFNLLIPKKCGDIESNLLNPEFNWSNKKKYINELKKLAKSFQDNMSKLNQDNVFIDVINEGPQLPVE
ncbi:Phosphoenolpyruvate carboxykinase [seawater metagenome]|uniref:phosphoenolpyruvate carboxykinase (ATP) n=1 Tax=seawater metagenome TaxID=1561972 RepID=A0A5E8CM24_9ZZZZ